MERKEMIKRITSIINESADFDIEILNMMVDNDNDTSLFTAYLNTGDFVCLEDNFELNCTLKCNIMGCIGCESLETKTVK